MRNTIPKKKLQQYISTIDKMLQEVEEYCTQADDTYGSMFDSINTKQGTLENYACYSSCIYNVFDTLTHLQEEFKELKYIKETK